MQSRSRFRSLLLLTPFELLWAVIGVILTVQGTLLQLSLPTGIPWLSGYSFSFQLAGMLLPACLGGPSAGIYAQVIYLALGLAGQQVFSYGGGLDYLHQPAFGYLLGFVPGAWVCGTIAFAIPPQPPTPKRPALPTGSKPVLSKLTPSPKQQQNKFREFRKLILASLAGLAVVHLTGLTYLLVKNPWDANLVSLIAKYSGYLLPGQLIVVFISVILAILYRRITLY